MATSTPTLYWPGTDESYYQDLTRLLKKQLLAPRSRTLIRIKPPALEYIPVGREGFCECVYDLGEIGRALDTESMLRRSISKHLSLCLKEGWRLTGKTPETINYIKRRIEEIQMVTDTPFDLIVRDICSNVITYSNAFIVFKRDSRYSSGKSVIKGGKTLEPIAGVFTADPTSMRINRNRWGQVKRYQQVIQDDSGEYKSFSKYFDPADVIHIYYDRKTGMAWGTPFVIPVLDDIRLLRNLEEIANRICHKGAFPLYHCKVGTEKFPAIEFEDGRSEVLDAQEAIQEHPPSGIYVTSERIELKAVDAGSAVKDITKYLEYFENRVISGLNLSGVDIGRGDTANRGTAITMSKNLQNQCKDFQRVISIFLTQIFDELLYEGGYLVNEETRVEFYFPEIDVETQQVVQNHAMALYQGHAISENEMRKKIGMEPVPESERKSMFFELIEKPRIKLGKLGSLSKTENAIKSKNQPENQFGKKPARTQPVNVKVNKLKIEKIFSDVKEVIDKNNPVHIKNTATVLKELLTESLPEDLHDRINSLVNGAKFTQSNIYLQMDFIKTRLEEML